MANDHRTFHVNEKNWKLMSIRQSKLKRAEQLRMCYPRGRSVPPFDELPSHAARHYPGLDAAREVNSALI